MAKYTKVDPERLELVERCCICGRLFFRETHNQRACNLWQMKGKKRSACVWMRAYITRLKNETDYHKRKKNKKITGRPRYTTRETVKTPSGCKLVQTDSGRCLKYVDCAHKSKCLMAVPLHWKGFASYNGCPGYEMEERVRSEMNPNYDYDTTWEGCGKGYQL